MFSPQHGRIAPRSVRSDTLTFRSLRASAFQRAEQRELNHSGVPFVIRLFFIVFFSFTTYNRQGPHQTLLIMNERILFMNKKDVLELKKRFTKNGCSFTKLCGCYVDSEKNIVLRLSETFLNLKEDEFYKYLEIAKKTLSGSLGNQLLELHFPMEQEFSGGRQQFLMGLKESQLKNDDLLERLYEQIVEHYDFVGNYLILIFYDSYDVMKKTTDRQNLEESEEVFSYLLCALCPVTLSKPALGYYAEENRIGARIRDWIVGVPETGFLFPAFTDRSSDVHSVLYYNKNPKETHHEFIKGFFGCQPVATAAEQKETFQTIFQETLGAEKATDNLYFLEMQQNLNQMLEEQFPEGEETESEEPFVLTPASVQTMLEEIGVPEEFSRQIERSYTEEFSEALPKVEALIDKKALTIQEQKQKEFDLQQQVDVLTQQVEEQKVQIESVKAEAAATLESEQGHLIVKTTEETAQKIMAQRIDGQKYLVIPIAEDEVATINGVNTVLEVPSL